MRTSVEKKWRGDGEMGAGGRDVGLERAGFLWGRGLAKDRKDNKQAREM